MSLPAYTSVNTVLALAPRVGSFTSVTSADIFGFIERTSVRIDGYLSKRYDTPFVDTPPDIIRISSDLSMSLTLRRLLAFEGESVSEWYERFIGEDEGAKEDLEAYQSGKMVLVNSAGELVTTTGAAGRIITSGNTSYKPAFDMRHNRNQRIDTDRISDEVSEDT